VDTLSSRTKEQIATVLISDLEDFYPDRAATINADGTYSAVDTGSTVRNPRDEVPTTTHDMSDMYKWQYNDKLYGSHAKVSEGMQNYIDDIKRAWGKEDKYYKNVIYIDTFKSVSKQLEELED